MNNKIKLIILLSIIAGAGGFLFFFSEDKKIITIENNNLITETKDSEKQNEETKTAIETDSGKAEEKKEETASIKDEEKNETATEEKKTEDDVELKSGSVDWGFSTGRAETIDTIVIHTVYNQLDEDRYDLEKILKIFKNYGVAPHYIIERSGAVHQLVAEKDTAYHAGKSVMPDGRTGVNNFSIGIEVISAEDDEPKNAQYQSLKKLIGQIESRHKIKYILGHSDIAPGRKTDPWNFDWKKIGGKKK